MAFDILYWFSRLEFALKEARFLRSNVVGAKARAAWEDFVVTHEGAYKLSESGRRLIQAAPSVQRVTDTGLEFVPIEFTPMIAISERSYLLHVVRNNLFHGGKNSVEGWDDPDRIRLLLPFVLANLAEIAKLGDLWNGYKREY
jgi:hypothetical protein